MSFQSSQALQKAVFGHLSSDPSITNIVGGAIFDAAPPNQTYGTYITLGDEDVRAQQGFDTVITTHKFRISVITNQGGFASAKDLAGRVSDRLTNAELALETGQLIDMHLETARAYKTKGNTARKVDLSFKALIENS